MAVEIEYLNNAPKEARDKLVSKIKQVFMLGVRNVENVMICYLHSSIAEGKCEFCLFSFRDIPFVTIPENEIYMNYSEILKVHVPSIGYFEKEIRKKFVCLCPYEIEEIRREFMFRYSAKMGKLFKNILNNEEGNVRVFFGAYMGEYEEVGRVFI